MRLEGSNIRSGSPDLRPVTSDNFDLTAEWCLNQVGSLIFSAFCKEVKGVAVLATDLRSFTNNGQTYEAVVSREINSPDTGKVRGFEAACQQTYDLLPGPLSGLGLQANYTYVKSSGVPQPTLDPGDPSVVGGLVSNIDISGFPLQGLSKHNFNITPGPLATARGHAGRDAAEHRQGGRLRRRGVRPLRHGDAVKTLAILALLAATPAAAQVTAVRVNGVGFAPAAPKRAIVESEAATPVDWRVEDARGAVLLRGRTIPYGRDRASGRSLHRVDFGALRTPGRDLRLVAGGAASPRFAIGLRLYRPLARDALAYFYHNRAGTPIEARYAGGARWARPAGHPREVAGCVSGIDGKRNRWDDCGYTLDVTGGWYDAGDHGKYVVNGGIAVWTLLNLHEHRRARFADGALAIPEAGNGVDDLLDEARRQVEFLLRMQVPDGRRMRLPVAQPDATKPLTFTEVDTGGMAHHKVADAKWTALPMRPDRDPERRVLHPPSTAATLNLAAVAAQCARVWRTVDPAFARRCADAAASAWAAAERNPEIYAVSEFTGSGGYGDRDLTDERFWAAAELYASGDARLLGALKAAPFLARTAGEPGWPSTASLGLVTLAIGDTPLAAEAKRRIVTAADGWVRERDRTGFAIPYASTDFAWGSNSNLLNRAMLLALAADWTGEARYREAVVDVVDYLLGRNPVGRSYVSGYGPDPMRSPHHRFWAAYFDPAYPPPPPGALSGGPNSRGTGGDAVADALKGKCAPMTCWADDGRAFSLNEIAINWNAPLAWVAAWLDATE